jgi:hypothetical protein
MRFLASRSAPPRALGDVMVDIAGKQQNFCSEIMLDIPASSQNYFPIGNFYCNRRLEIKYFPIGAFLDPRRNCFRGEYHGRGAP